MWNDIKVIQSSNQSVKKYVFTKDNAVAESVLYKYPSYKDRTVICCSTQSGCPVGCRFCGAGDYFVRSLTTDEILSQPVRLLEDSCKEENIGVEDINRLQIMFMSQGEPLLNLKNLIPALHKLYELYPSAKLLISTIGPRINYDDLWEACRDIPTIGLQFSVHESTDSKRNQLIPFAAKLNLQEIAHHGNWFAKITGRSPFFNYCVHEENNTDEDVARLVLHFDSDIWQATISVICERDEHVAAANERQKELAENFRDKLRAKGFQTRVFDPAGQDDIGGGCGQLWFVQDWMKQNPDKAIPSVGHGKRVVHTPRKLELSVI